MQMQLSNEETSLLVQILTTAHDTLLREISHSDTLEAKDLLRGHVAIVERLRQQLTTRKGA